MKIIDINQNDVDHETKNEIDTSYEMDDHHISNTLDEVEDDQVRIRNVVEEIDCNISLFSSFALFVFLK